MKTIFLSCFILASLTAAKAQCIRVYVSEQVKGIEIPVQRVEFEVYVNDTLKKKLASDNSGFLTRLSLNNGKYNVKIKSAEFAEAVMKDVVVKDFKSTDITLNLTPTRTTNTKEKIITLESNEK